MPYNLEKMLKESIKQTLLENPHLIVEQKPPGGAGPTWAWIRKILAREAVGQAKVLATEIGLGGIRGIKTVIGEILGTIPRFTRNAWKVLPLSAWGGKKKALSYAAGLVGWHLYIAMQQRGMAIGQTWGMTEKQAEEFYAFNQRQLDLFEYFKWMIASGYEGNLMANPEVPTEDWLNKRAQQIMAQLVESGTKCEELDPIAALSHGRVRSICGPEFSQDPDTGEIHNCGDPDRLKQSVQALKLKCTQQDWKAIATQLNTPIAAGQEDPAAARAVNPKHPEYNIINTALKNKDAIFEGMTNPEFAESKSVLDALLNRVCAVHAQTAGTGIDWEGCSKDNRGTGGRPQGYDNLSADEKADFDFFVYALWDEDTAARMDKEPLPTELAGTEAETEPGTEPA